MSDTARPHPSYLLGSSYYPEQWARSRWMDDFAKMADIGFNTVRMGEFAWASFEPEPGRFDFGWMDCAVELASRHGIKTVLCTPTAAFPAWLRQAHPEVLGGNERGAFDFGARKGHCVTAPALLEANDRIVTALADHYGGSDDILAWQIDNEPGFPFALFDPVTLVSFREWLRSRYAALDALNDAWKTAFWSHVYTDWEQIEFPVNRPDGDWNPGQYLDYRRFFSDSFLAYLRRQVDILRPRAPRQPLFTNWPNTFWSVDTFASRAFLDFTAWDNYAPDPGLFPWRNYFGASGTHHDLARNASRSRRGFLVAEQKAQVAAHADPAGIRLQTYGDLAHGAFGTIFFEWRPPLGGGEIGYPSVLLPDGSFGPAEESYRRLSKELKRIAPRLDGARTVADIAVIYSYENAWDQGFWSGADGYDTEATRYHQGFRIGSGRNVDVIPPPENDADLSGYRIVVAPGLRTVSDNMANCLLRFVDAGGVLVINRETGTRDEHNRLRESLPPGPFARVAGVEVVATASTAAMAGNLIAGASDQGVRDGGIAIRLAGGESFSPATRVELLRAISPDKLERLASFTGGRLNDSPAITVNRRSGGGAVVYVATDSYEHPFYEEIARQIGRRFGVSPLLPEVPPGIEITERETATERFLLLLNHTPETQVLSFLGDEVWTEIIAERTVTGRLEISPLGVAILSRRHEQ
ncbi:MAG: beta-galactosidase [Akkermansiaceae bacterium]|nr:beta-galactosidase [Armatimonadota bacterium]